MFTRVFNCIYSFSISTDFSVWEAQFYYQFDYQSNDQLLLPILDFFLEAVLSVSAAACLA